MKGLIRWVARFVVLTLVMLALVVAVLIFTSNGPDVRGPFEGQIVDADTRAPIEGAHVVVVWTHLTNWFEGGRREVDARETVTDAEGRWSIPERPTPFWEGGIAGVRRRFYVFAPGFDVAEPGGTPRDQYAVRESTVTTMRRITAREERCKLLPFASGMMAGDTAKTAQLYSDAVTAEREQLRCNEVRP